MTLIYILHPIRACPHYAWWRRATWRGPSGVVCLELPPVGVETLGEFKNTGLAKSTPCGTVCLEDGPHGAACMLLDVNAVQAHALHAWNMFPRHKA